MGPRSDDHGVARRNLDLHAEHTGTLQAGPYDFIDFNVNDHDYEYMTGRSRFEQLCLNQQGTVYKTKPVRIIDGSLWSEPVQASMYLCNTALVAPSDPGLPPPNPAAGSNSYWVAGIFMTGANLSLPQVECMGKTYTYLDDNGNSQSWDSDPDHTEYLKRPPTFCGTFANPNLVEITVISKTPFPAPLYFAQYVQKQVLTVLGQPPQP